ncbi:sugar phosphate isomerase/epimerase family protein [Paenibacillus sp. GCM10027627]|uniref:sugar phosphate isomerase/epimerase family protein n=1 Tax=unclassified Paenibacillus TaxID=185978 RepID=UPI0036269B06
MKLGISTYSLHQAVAAGEMSVTDVIDFIASIGADHAEIVPIGYSLPDHPGLVDDIRNAAERGRIELSGYAVGANFAGLDEEGFARELERLKREVDACAALGITRMRHDVASSEDRSIGNFLAELPKLTEACRIIADYAAGYGITTSVENHGYFVQHSDRVQALVHAVGRDNFRTTLDVGNFLCVDEDPPTAVAKNVGLASMVHLKDFYFRPANRYPGEGWFNTAGGNWLRGAIVGQGDIDIPRVLRTVKDSGYDGYLSIEFEGMEECRSATKMAFEYVKRLWTELSE